MSEMATRDGERIFVRLLNEGTDVFRPVEAAPLADGTFRIAGEQGYEQGDEEWEFEPGSVVVCTRRMLSGEMVLIASKRS